MAQTGQDPLLEVPRIRVASLQHVATVVRLDHDRCATAKLFGHQRSDVTEVHHRRNLYALVSGGEAEIVDGVVRNRERMKIDLADAEVSARLDLFDPISERFLAPARFVSVYSEAFADVGVVCFCRNVNG